MKSKVAILIAVAMIASILAAGCISSTNTSSNQSAQQAPSSSTGHDKALQAVIDDDQQSYINATWTQTVNKSVQWINDTTAMVTFKLGYSNSTLKYTAKYQKFASESQASDYVNAIDQGYNSTSAIALLSNPALTTASSTNTHKNYENVTNIIPTTTAYTKLLRNEATTYTGSYIIQVRDVVVTFTAIVNKSASSSPTPS